MENNKKELRSKYKALRNHFSEDEIHEKSLAIANQLLKLPVWDKTYFHIFLPIREHNEIDTELILHLLSGRDKEIIVSKTVFETRSMVHYLLTDNTKIRKNKYNIPEPVGGPDDSGEIPSSKIDVVFVPLLAFDKEGHRVGYGKGFYDKFLRECKPETIKIGLSFFEVETQINDVHEEDMKLDYCITPESIYKF